MKYLNEYYIEELRELWQEELDNETGRSVQDFCRAHGISTTSFNDLVGTRTSVRTGPVVKPSRVERYERMVQDLEEIKQNKLVLTPEILEHCKQLFRDGKEFDEIAEITGANEWDLMGELLGLWEDRQIERYGFNKNNLYYRSIIDLMNDGFSDQLIAELFSVSAGKIKIFRLRNLSKIKKPAEPVQEIKPVQENEIKLKKVITSEERRKKINERNKAYRARKKAENPELYKSKIREQSRRQYEKQKNNPEFREKMNQRARDYRKKKIAEDPEFLEKRREIAKKSYRKRAEEKSKELANKWKTNGEEK